MADVCKIPGACRWESASSRACRCRGGVRYHEGTSAKRFSGHHCSYHPFHRIVNELVNDEEIVSSTKSPQGRRRPQTAQQAADHLNLKRTDARLAATCWHGWQRTRPLVDVGPLGVMFDFSCNFHRNRHTPKTIEIGLVGFCLIFAAC